MARAKKIEDTTRKSVTSARNSAGTAAVQAKVRTITVAEDQVRMRAYELYLQRNGNGGTPEEDWYRAEAELRGKSA